MNGAPTRCLRGAQRVREACAGSRRHVSVYINVEMNE